MIWLVPQKFDPRNVSIDGEQVEKFILVYSLRNTSRKQKQMSNRRQTKEYSSTRMRQQALPCITIPPKREAQMRRERERKMGESAYTSASRLDTSTVHLSLVPLIPGGNPPPKAAAMAAALLPIYKWHEVTQWKLSQKEGKRRNYPALSQHLMHLWKSNCHIQIKRMWLGFHK